MAQDQDRVELLAAALRLAPATARALLDYYDQIDLWGHDYVNRVLRILYGRTIPEILGLREEVE
jgi:hypothetical protein